jgi:hypothetical protein
MHAILCPVHGGVQPSFSAGFGLVVGIILPSTVYIIPLVNVAAFVLDPEFPPLVLPPVFPVDALDPNKKFNRPLFIAAQIRAAAGIPQLIPNKFVICIICALVFPAPTCGRTRKYAANPMAIIKKIYLFFMN